MVNKKVNKNHDIKGEYRLLWNTFVLYKTKAPMQSKKTAPRGLFDEFDVQEKLSKLKDPLEQLSKKINFEQFRRILDSMQEAQERKSNAGAKPYDVVLMFKILILQRLYSLSDEQMEFQINDRLSFRRFLGMTLSHRVPDCNTIWNFKEKLKDNDNEKKLFDHLYSILEKGGLIMNTGKMVDASFHEVPRQRNSRDENEQLKKGEVPQTWQNKPDKLSHKDTEATWTKKNDQSYYGYKNHVKADAKSKLIDKYHVTTASTHDSQALEHLLTEKDEGQALYADSAYTGEDQEKTIVKAKMINRVHEKGYRNKPLTSSQKENNREKSKVRARVEHIFGFMENSMHEASYMRCIGMARAKVTIGLTNLAYNICRAVQLGLNMFTQRDTCAYS